METTGFTETQLTVRDAVGALCSQFPNSYWQEHDQKEEDPKEFHAALAKDGWLGIALPEELGGSGLGISEATMMMQTITVSFMHFVFLFPIPCRTELAKQTLSLKIWECEVG